MTEQPARAAAPASRVRGIVLALFAAATLLGALAATPSPSEAQATPASSTRPANRRAATKVPPTKAARPARTARHVAPVFRIAAPCASSEWPEAPDPPEATEVTEAPELLRGPPEQALGAMARDVELVEEVRACAERDGTDGARCRALLVAHLRARLTQHPAPRQYPGTVDAGGRLGARVSRDVLRSLVARRDPALVPLWIDALQRPPLVDLALLALRELGNPTWAFALAPLLRTPEHGAAALDVVLALARDPGLVVLAALEGGPVAPSASARLSLTVERSSLETRVRMVDALVGPPLDAAPESVTFVLSTLAAIVGSSDPRAHELENAVAWRTWWRACRAPSRSPRPRAP